MTEILCQYFRFVNVNVIRHFANGMSEVLRRIRRGETQGKGYRRTKSEKFIETHQTEI